MSEKVKVAFDITPLVGEKTGVGLVAEELFFGLSKRDEIDLEGYLISFRGYEKVKNILPDGDDFTFIKFPARLAQNLWTKFDWPVIEGFEVVHGINYVTPPSTGAVELVTIHDLTAWRYPELLDKSNQNYPGLVSRAIKRGAHIHTVSDNVASEIQEFLNIDESKVHVIHNGFQALSKGDPKKALDIVGSPYILAIGTIEPRKDYETLLLAMNEVWKIFPDYKLVIIGKDGWGVDRYNQVLTSLEYKENILRLGFVDPETKLNMLSGASLLAFPSLYEGFGLPVLEAMSVSVPVVSTQVGSIPEISAGAAVLVPPKSPNALAAAILEVLENEDVKNHLIKSGLERVKDFSWDESISKFVELYKKLAS